MKTTNSLREDYFIDVYSRNDDPWDYESSDYEKKKYQATIDALSKETYANAFEIGCSIGVLSQMLAAKCKRLLSVDVSDLPIQKARERLKNYPQVTIQKMSVPSEFPRDSFDLIVLSEVGYYWSLQDLYRTQQLITEHLQPNAQLLLVHWTPFVPDYPLTGDQVHNSFINLAKDSNTLRHIVGKTEEKYRLDLFEKII